MRKRSEAPPKIEPTGLSAGTLAQARRAPKIEDGGLLSAAHAENTASFPILKCFLSAQTTRYARVLTRAANFLFCPPGRRREDSLCSNAFSSSFNKEAFFCGISASKKKRGYSRDAFHTWCCAYFSGFEEARRHMSTAHWHYRSHSASALVCVLLQS